MRKKKEAKKRETARNILLRDVPGDVWALILQMKSRILAENSIRGSVSHHEAVYRLLRKAGKGDERL